MRSPYWSRRSTARGASIFPAARCWRRRKKERRILKGDLQSAPARDARHRVDSIAAARVVASIAAADHATAPADLRAMGDVPHFGVTAATGLHSAAHDRKARAVHLAHPPDL